MSRSLVENIYTYRQRARKGIRQQLQYMEPNLGYISGMLDTLMPNSVCTDFPLRHRLQRQH